MTASYRIVRVTSHTWPIRLRNGHSCAHPSRCEHNQLLMSRCLYSVHHQTKYLRLLLHTHFQVPFLCIWNTEEYSVHVYVNRLKLRNVKEAAGQPGT